jgi:ribosome-binding ATPase YchF (GTP1/OBG family)
MKRTTIIKIIRNHLEETHSKQKPQLETYTYQELKKVLYIYNLKDEPVTDENKNTDI